MKKLLSLAALGSLVTAVFFLAVQPVWAAGVEERIKALENELNDLKGEQMEFRKEATAAAKKMPKWSYRRGSGLKITAGDKSWQYGIHARAHNWLLFRDGEADSRGGDGEVFARRARLHQYFCTENCFYEFEFGLDMDGFGGDSGLSNSQRFKTTIHFERINPWLPAYWFGKDVSNSLIRRRSSRNDGQLDFDIITRSLFNTGSIGNGMGLGWRGLDLRSLGIPGNINWFTVTRGNVSAGDGVGRFSDKTDYTVSLGVRPFERTKSKWLKGIELSWGAFFCSQDHNAEEEPGECDRFRLRETDGPVRETLWEADHTGNEDGRGHLVATALRWRIGPYQLRTMGAWARMGRSEGNVHMRGWEINNQVAIWSPKGFLTGSSSKKNTILLSHTFNRADGYCNPPACDNDDQYDSNHLILNQVAAWWILARRTAAGVVWNHYDAKKVVDSEQVDLGCRDPGVSGRGCTWDNVMVVFRYEF